MNGDAMVPVDFDATDLRVTACASCGELWWAEVMLVHGLVVVREWHIDSCADWAGMTDQVPPDDVVAAPLGEGALVVFGPELAGLSVLAPPRAPLRPDDLRRLTDDR